MILIGLYIYIFCGILYMVKTHKLIKRAFDETNYSLINVVCTILFAVLCWLPLYIYGIVCLCRGIIDAKEKIKEEHKEN